jgi:NAD(P)-dependent dehydrogenase (short-subunit alcohol dehydrogenase family)
MGEMLKGKVAVVTGGASGIGRATAALFAREGANVVVADYEPTGGQDTVKMIKGEGGEAFFVETDVSRPEDVERMVKETVKTYGLLDILFNNAGVGETAKATEASLEHWERVLAINLRGVFLGCKYAIPRMIRNGGGSIINNASILAEVGFSEATAYAASKHGIVGLTQTIAIDYAAQGIRANTVCPGFIRTPMVMKGLDEETRGYIAGLHPLGRMGEPEEVAEAVLFLASDRSSFVTGTCLFVDGGYTAR